jgi:hypothetical protein
MYGTEVASQSHRGVYASQCCCGRVLYAVWHHVLQCESGLGDEARTVMHPARPGADFRVAEGQR